MASAPSPSGETDLARMLRTLAPAIRPGEFVFVTRPTVERLDADALIREDEGITHVLRRDIADEEGWAYDFVAAWITLHVHSSLAGVGLTAAVGQALADADISCNVIAGYFHDHVLVPADRKHLALSALLQLSSGALPRD
jgi:hypothetical protein